MGDLTEPDPQRSLARTVPGRENEPGLREAGLLEHTIPHGGALPPHVLTIRPFLWLVIAEAVAALAFWGFFGVVFADAAYRFHATSREMAILGVALSVPFAVSIPIQGVLVDRWSPKWLNVCGYAVMLFAIPLAWKGGSLPWSYAAAFLIGAGFAAVEPSRSALTGLLVEAPLLVQANGMMSAAYQLALVVGTLVAGFMLSTKGHGSLVYLTALIAGSTSVLVLLLIPDVRQEGEKPTLSMRDLAQGFQTSWRKLDLRLLLLVTTLGWALVNVFFILEPIFIRTTLHRGQDAVLYLWAVHGAGAMLGALMVARIKRSFGHELLLVGIGVLALGVGLLIYTGIGTYQFALLGALTMGAGLSFFFAPSLALIQRAAGEEQRGRVTSVFGTVQESIGLVGSLVIVVLGAMVIVRATLIGVGVVLVLTGALGTIASRVSGAGSSAEH
jgi:MFS family permease